MKRKTPDHPKFRTLQKALRLPDYSIVGLLELLWHFTADFAPQGDIGRYPDARIAEGCRWGGAPGRLVGALVDAGWVDTCPCHRLTIHDWGAHLDGSVAKYLQRKGLTPIMSGQCLQRSAIKSDPPVPMPVPMPSPCQGESAKAAAPAAEKPPPRTPTPKPQPAPKGYALDAQYADFRRLFGEWAGSDEAGQPMLIESDFTGHAWREWRALDGLQRQAAIDGLRERVGAVDWASTRNRDPVWYLRQREWTRAPTLPIRQAENSIDRAMRRLS